MLAVYISGLTVRAQVPVLPPAAAVMVACPARTAVMTPSELTVATATELLKIAPDYDVMITAESKGIPLAYEMARQRGGERWLLARKAPKLYMRDVLKCEVRSITTDANQVLYLDGYDAAYMRGKRVLIVDDVISTGESLHALETLVHEAGGKVVGKMAVLAEGDAIGKFPPSFSIQTFVPFVPPR